MHSEHTVFPPELALPGEQSAQLVAAPYVLHPLPHGKLPAALSGTLWRPAPHDLQFGYGSVPTSVPRPPTSSYVPLLHNFFGFAAPPAPLPSQTYPFGQGVHAALVPATSLIFPASHVRHMEIAVLQYLPLAHSSVPVPHVSALAHRFSTASVTAKIQTRMAAPTGPTCAIC